MISDPSILVLLVIVYTVGLLCGFLCGALMSKAKSYDEAFGEHESDAPYPRIHD
jgi:hypothetical protein